jgi:hypothetical protein
MYNRRFNDFRDYSDTTLSEWSETLGKTKESWEKFTSAVLPGIYQRTIQNKQKQGERLDSRKQVPIIENGTNVMIKDPMKTSKWDADYEGPYVVKRRSKGGAYILEDALGVELPRRVTIEMIKPVDTFAVSKEKTTKKLGRIIDHRVEGGGFVYLIKKPKKQGTEWIKGVDFKDTKPITRYWKKKRNQPGEAREPTGKGTPIKEPAQARTKRKEVQVPLSSTAGLGGSHVKGLEPQKQRTTDTPGGNSRWAGRLQKEVRRKHTLDM